MTDNERGEGAAVEKNGGLAGEGRHRLRRKEAAATVDVTQG